MFTVEQRDALRERLLRLAAEDERVVAGAAVGSLVVNGGGRFSDVDLTFGIADHAQVADVLDDWTRSLIDELEAVQLADLERGPTTYRVFLLPDALQLDLSMTPAAQFRPAGPRFRLLFGETAAGKAEVLTPTVGGPLPSHAVGRRGYLRVGRHLRATHTRVHRARACLAGRALRRRRARPRALACLPPPRLPPVQARGYDDLSAETLGRYKDAHVGVVEPAALRAALAASVLALMHEATEARLPQAHVVAERLSELH